jgi:membrane-bound metal-dependent hydrolase YbcI (DUF457 family)
MITRHHLGLACGGTLILYLPLVFGNPFLLPVVIGGVCIGVVLPDIQMKRPRRFTALSPVWLLVQVFKLTVLRLYISLCESIFAMQPVPEDKRLTHSIPGLFFLTGLITLVIFIITEVFPSSPVLHYIRVFFAGIIVGLLFHFLEDICTRKGLCLMYPFNETYRISGSIRPCDPDDFRIRYFHILTGFAIAISILFYCTVLCPEYLKWLVSIGAVTACTVIMLRHADVRMNVAA